MVAGYPAPPAPALERQTPYRISDRFAVESVIGLPWNRWSECGGIGDRFAVESVIEMAWNTHS